MHTPYVGGGHITTLRGGGAVNYKILESCHALLTFSLCSATCSRSGITAHHYSTGISLLRHCDEVMAEIDFIMLVFGVGRSLAVIHLCGAGSLEHTGNIEGKRTLEFTCACICLDCLFLTGGCIDGVVSVSIDVKAIQIADSAGIAVDIELLTECLLGTQQVVYMVGAKDETTIRGRNLELIESLFQTDKVIKSKTMSACRRVCRAGSLEDGGLVRIPPVRTVRAAFANLASLRALA